jgi:hypothetical protein
MTDTPDARWPKTPSDAIDWEKAFEDPEAGLISLIRQARSATALRECMIAVVTRLYLRKDDPSEVERFVGQLKGMIPDQVSPKQLSRVADAMVGILRQIKADRIRKVLEFEAAKVATPLKVAAPSMAPTNIADSAEPLDDRRSKSEPPKLTALAEEVIAGGWKKAIYIAGGVAGAILVVGYMIDAYLDAAPQREAKRKAALLIAQIQAVSRGDAIGTHVYGGSIRVDRVGEHAAVVVEGLSPGQCAHAGWIYANKGDVMVNGAMPSNASLNTLTALCGATSGSATLTWIPRPEGGRKDSETKR